MNRETPLQLLAIRLFAIALVAAGVGAIAKMVYGLFTGSLGIDLGFLCLFIGKGLLERKELWRKWAVFVAWIGIICIPVVAVLLVRGHGETTLSFGGMEFGYHPSPFPIAALLIGALFFCLWQQRVLTRPSVRGSFSPDGEKNGWWLAIAIASLIVHGGDISQEFMMANLLRSIEYYDVTVEAFDAKTGAKLDVATHFSSMDRKSFQKMWSTGTDHGFEVRGFGMPPIELRVSADGHQEKKVTLSPAKQHQTVRVELDDIPTNGQP